MAMGKLYKEDELIKMQLGADSYSPKEQCTEWGCTLAPPGKLGKFMLMAARM